jgi:hypothetical protein
VHDRWRGIIKLGARADVTKGINSACDENNKIFQLS